MTTPMDVDTRFEVIDLMHRYSTAIDTRDWVLFRNVFTDSAHIDYGFGTWDDADAFTQVMQQGHDPLGRTVHRLSNIVVTAGDPMTVRTYGDNINMDTSGTSGHHGAAWYDDEVVRTADGLKISRRTVTMVIFEPITTNPAATGS